jgi:Electron transfer DM13
MARPSRRTGGIVAGTAALTAAVALPLFQPWRLVTDRFVDEALPGAAPISMTSSSTAPPTISGGPGSGPSQQPSTSTPTGPRKLAAGRLISHEHETTGTVAILRLPDGSRILRLENLDTSDGPDLKVWLSDAAVLEGTGGWHLFDDGRYRDLGDLKGNHGNQNYAIPADADLSVLRSVAIWCDRFNVSFGAAELTEN